MITKHLNILNWLRFKNFDLKMISVKFVSFEYLSYCGYINKMTLFDHIYLCYFILKVEVPLSDGLSNDSVQIFFSIYC